MKKVFYVMSIFMLTLMASCGDKQAANSVTLQVEPQIGDLAQFITLADSEATISLSDEKEEGKDIKRILSSLALNVDKPVASNYSFGFDVMVLDANHNEITTLPSYSINSNYDMSNGSYSHILPVGPVRAQMNRTEDAEDWNEEAQQMWAKVRKEGKYLVIKPDNSFAKFVAYNSSDANSSSSDDSSESDEVEESSLSTENILLPSQLKGSVEVIEASKGLTSLGYPEVTVTFKLLKTVNTAPLLSQYGQMWIVGVAQNEKGVDVKDLLPSYKEWRSHDSDGNEFKSFLEGEPDDTITLEFTGSKDNSSNVASDLNQVEKFKLKLTK